MKRFFKALIATSLVVVMLFSMTACNKKELKGFDIDLAREVAKVLDVEVEFKEIDWDMKEMELTTNLIDVVWNGFTYTEDRDNGYYDEDRKQQIGGLDFTKFYMENKQVAVVKKDNASAYTSNASFAGKKGCAEASSAGEKTITDILKLESDQLGKQLDVFVGVKAGTYDFGVVDSSMASEYIISEKGAYHDSLAVVDVEGVEKEYYAVAFREGSNLTNVFNKVLKDLFADGTVEKVAKEYALDGVIYNGFADFDDSAFAYPTDGDYKAVKDAGKIVIGYTIFAPMAFMPE